MSETFGSRLAFLITDRLLPIVDVCLLSGDYCRYFSVVYWDLGIGFVDHQTWGRLRGSYLGETHRL